MIERAVKIQIAVAAVALAVTLFALYQLPSMIRAKASLQKEIAQLEERRKRETAQLETERARLRRELAHLEERKKEAERAISSLTSAINAQRSAPAPQRSPSSAKRSAPAPQRSPSSAKRSAPAPQPIRFRARADAVPGMQDRTGRQIHDYRLWLDAPEGQKRQIERVVYTFDHPTFRQKTQQSSDPSTGFAVGYRGWGCLYVVPVEIRFKDGRVDKKLFDMCGSLDRGATQK